MKPSFWAVDCIRDRLRLHPCPSWWIWVPLFLMWMASLLCVCVCVCEHIYDFCSFSVDDVIFLRNTVCERHFVEFRRWFLAICAGEFPASDFFCVYLMFLESDPNCLPVSPMYDLSQPLQGLSYTTSLIWPMSFLSFEWPRRLFSVFVGCIVVEMLYFFNSLNFLRSAFFIWNYNHAFWWRIIILL